MTANSTPSRRVLPLIMLIAVAVAGPVAGQSESQSDLRRENQRLQTRVSDLESELAASRVQIDQLTARIAELERLLREALRTDRAVPQPSTMPAEEVTIDETVASATPRALFAAMQSSYREATETMELGDPKSQQRRAYQMQVRSWVPRFNREHRSPIAWYVRLLETDRSNRGYTAKLEAIDPKSRVALGDPFFVSVPRPQALRLDELSQRGMPMDVLLLRGTLVSDARYNEQRSESSPFDNPPLVGPFAEFGFSVEVRSLLPAAEDEEYQRLEREEASKKEAG